jgi:ABC-2 type transport system permease protein
MAWVFIRLKGRLIANGLRGGGKRVVGTVLAAIYGAILAVAGFAALATAGGRGADSAVVAILFGAALAVGWAIFPLLGFGSDETLDPTRLELLPLSRRDLMTGLLAASLVGIGPLATLAALAGGIAGFAPPGPGAVLVVAAVLVQFVLCVALSRAIVTALSAALRSRKGRDLRVILVTLVALLPQLLRFVFVPAHASLHSLRPVANVVGWLPLALPMRAMVAAADGRPLTALGELTLGALTVVALGWWWAQSLERIATAPEPAARPAASSASSEAPDPRADPLFGSLLAWLPRNRTGAVAAREIRVSWRDPRRRVQVLSTVLFPFLVMAGILARGVSHRPSLVYAALLAVALGGGRANNQLGMDGRAWWVHEASGADWQSDFGGKNLSLAFTSLPITVVVAVVLAGLSGGWSQLLPVVLLGVALCEVQLGIGNVVSVRAPWAVPASRSNAWAANTGQGCFAGLIGLLALFVMGLLAVPAIVAIIAVRASTGRLLIALASLVYGYCLWRLGSWIAVRDANRRGPELLATLSEGSGAT